MTRKPQRGQAGSRGLDRWSGGRQSARARIATGVVVPEIGTGFALTPETRVFAIGGEFARQLEAGLAAAGVQVSSVDRASQLVEVRTNPRHGLLNKLTPPAIQQELDWAAGQRFPEAALLPAGPDWVDPCLPDRAPAGPMPMIRGRRAALAEYFGRAFSSEVVLLDLDRVEAWYDRRTRLALHGTPNPRAYANDSARFAFKRVGVEEAIATLRGICTLLKRRNDAQKIVLTVSPVPVERTYTADDVIVANAISKSALHAAAVAVASSMSDVDYFPAYEAVTTSDPARAWAEDRRTVSAELVEAVVEAFMRRYRLSLAPSTRTAGTA